jgi:hypothetical protein
MVYFGKFISWPVGKCPNMERSDVFSLFGKQQKIAPLITGYPLLNLTFLSEKTKSYNPYPQVSEICEIIPAIVISPFSKPHNGQDILGKPYSQSVSTQILCIK